MDNGKQRKHLRESTHFSLSKNLADAIDFYNQKLGFETDLLIPEEDPFFWDRVS